MGDELFYIGVTHENAPLWVRERMHLDADGQRAALHRLGRLAEGRMLVNTCERFELYVCADGFTLADCAAELMNWCQLPVFVLGDCVRIKKASEAARHLLEVAAGLHSRIVGEPAILGQVRDAYLRALQLRSLDPVLAALGRWAIQAGKRVRHETTIATGARSIASIAVERLIQQKGTLGDWAVAVVGTGKLANAVAAELAMRRAGRLIVVGRTAEHVQCVAERNGAQPAAMGELANVLGAVDAAVLCTGAATPIVNVSMLELHRLRPLHLLDLGVPRNAAPAVSGVSQVFLTHLDNITCDRIASRAAMEAARRIVEEAVERFLRWQKERKAVPCIVELLRTQGVAHARWSPGDRERLHRRIMCLKAEAAA